MCSEKGIQGFTSNTGNVNVEKFEPIIHNPTEVNIRETYCDNDGALTEYLTFYFWMFCCNNAQMKLMKAIDFRRHLSYIACIYCFNIHIAASYCLNETININLELLCLEIMLQSEWKGHFVKTSIHIQLTFCNAISTVVLFTVNNIIVGLPEKAN